MSKLIYLASPYTSKEPGVQEQRAKEIASIAGYLIGKGKNIFCPIAMSHYVAQNSDINATDHDMWMRLDLTVLERCDELYVVLMEGFFESKGVQEEIKFALEKQIPITYLKPDVRMTHVLDLTGLGEAL